MNHKWHFLNWGMYMPLFIIKSSIYRFGASYKLLRVSYCSNAHQWNNGHLDLLRFVTKHTHHTIASLIWIPIITEKSAWNIHLWKIKVCTIIALVRISSLLVSSRHEETYILVMRRNILIAMQAKIYKWTLYRTLNSQISNN